MCTWSYSKHTSAALQKAWLSTRTSKIGKEYWSSAMTKQLCRTAVDCYPYNYQRSSSDDVSSEYTTQHIDLPNSWCPSCLQTTLPSATSQRLNKLDPLQMVPQTWLMQISTLPSYLFDPPTSLTSPSLQLLCMTVTAARRYLETGFRQQEMLHAACRIV